jgi:hypothetical protein
MHNNAYIKIQKDLDMQLEKGNLEIVKYKGKYTK